MAPWWTKDSQVQDAVVSSLRTLDDNQRHRQDFNLRHLRLYGSHSIVGLGGSDYARPYNDGTLKMNVVKAVIDAVVAAISTVRPRPMFLTKRGDATLIKKAKNLNKFSLGQFHHVGQYELGQDIFRDAAIFGTGIEKIVERDGDLCAERVFPNELVVDDIEARYGKPRQLFQHKEVSRDLAAGLWPEFESEIRDAALVRDHNGSYLAHDGIVDPVSIIEAWHLPSRPDADDGRHVICTDNAVLLDEPCEFFPFTFFRWATRPLGFFGVGLAEELTNIQVEMNQLLKKIQESMNLASSQIWAQKGSVNKAYFSNQNWAVREYTGQPPTFLPVQAISPEYYTWVDRLWARAFEIAGVSQLTATGRKPAGLNSGAALREYQDVQSQRFQHVQQRWEYFHLDVARIMIRLARQIDEAGDGGYQIVARSDKGLEDMSFKDVSLEDDKYQMQVFPTSLLPQTPAGKLQTIQELGQISPEMQQLMLSQLDFPDVEQAVSLITAPLDMVDTLIDRFLSHEPLSEAYRPPEPFMDLGLALQRMQQALLRADMDGYPEERLELLRQFMSEAHALLQPPAPPPTMQPGAPAAPAGGPPAPPPGVPPGTPAAMQGPAALAGGGAVAA